MKLYGYENMGLPIEEIIPAALAEVTLCASPDELRQMAKFFSFCAIEMESMNSEYDHIHLPDQFKEFAESPHLVVVKDTQDEC
jgi:hypothetical protein